MGNLVSGKPVTPLTIKLRGLHIQRIILIRSYSHSHIRRQLWKGNRMWTDFITHVNKNSFDKKA